MHTRVFLVCFVVLLDLGLTHVLQDSFTGTGAVIAQHQCSILEWYGQRSQMDYQGRAIWSQQNLPQNAHDEDSSASSSCLIQGLVLAPHRTLWDAITYPCTGYLLLALKSSSFIEYNVSARHLSPLLKATCPGHHQRCYWPGIVRIQYISWYRVVLYLIITISSFTFNQEFFFHTVLTFYVVTKAITLGE